MSKKLTYEAERFVYPYVFLWSSCANALELAKGSSDRGIHFMTSMLLSSFCLEAYLNHLTMMKHGGDWRQFERTASPKKKLKVLSEIIGYELDIGKRPFQTFSQIFTFRNSVAHAKTEHLRVQIKMTLTTFLAPNQMPPEPLTKWEKLLTPESAQRFFNDMVAMIKELHAKAGLGNDPLGHLYAETKWKQL